MAKEIVRVRHLHFPYEAIPAKLRSDDEIRAVTYRVRAAGSFVLARVATGGFAYHVDLAEKATQTHPPKKLKKTAADSEPVQRSTRIELPAKMPYGTAILIGALEQPSGTVTVLRTLDEATGSVRSQASAQLVAHAVSAGIMHALRQGYEIDHPGPSAEPHDPDQSPEYMVNKFGVTSDMIAKFDAGVQEKSVILHEPIESGIEEERAQKLRLKLPDFSRLVLAPEETFLADPPDPDATLQ